jgi:hypothetical protein
VPRNANKLVPLLEIASVCLVWFCVALTLPKPDPHRLQGVSQQSPRGRYSEPHFVFADLDGDHKPDLALVELQNQRSAQTNYSILVKLSHGVESAIGVHGPMGGLRVAARDVNGDDHVDLVVTANLDAHFIEVLLNDGRGNFSVASPGDYSYLESDLDGSLEVQASKTHSDLATLAPIRSSHEDGRIESCSNVLPVCSDSRRRAQAVLAIHRPALPRQGRSPPACIALS